MKLEGLSINIFTNYGYQSSENEYQIDEVQLKEDILKKSINIIIIKYPIQKSRL